jgi:hypothetical protein
MQGIINVGEYRTSTAASTSQMSTEHFLWMETVGLLLYVRNVRQQQQNNKFSKLQTIPFNLMWTDCITQGQAKLWMYFDFWPIFHKTTSKFDMQLEFMYCILKPFTF